MKEIFADAFYWIALANPSDQGYRVATQFDFGSLALVTTEEVLTEFLNFYCGSGDYWRKAVYRMSRDILNDMSIVTIPQSTNSFNAGLELYNKRLDKGYSLTDCISMAAMRSRGIVDVLTSDVHFKQEGFNLLLP